MIFGIKKKFRNWFIDIDAGVIEDQGFSFNPSGTEERIIGFTPYPLSSLKEKSVESEERKKHNKLLAKRRAIVENIFKRLNRIGESLAVFAVISNQTETQCK